MHRRFTVLCLLLALGAGCSVDIGAPPKGPRIRIVSDINRADTIDAGPSEVMDIEISDSTGRLENPVVVAISGAPVGSLDTRLGMAIADPDGVPTTGISLTSSGSASFRIFFGEHAGRVPVIVSVPDLRLVDSLWFTVKPGAPARVRANPAETTVLVGGSYQQSAVASDRGGNDLTLSSPLSFSTADAAVSLSATGKVTGIAYGRAGVNVSYKSLSATGMVSVVPAGQLETVPPPLGLSDASIAVLATDGSGFKRYPTPQDASAPVWNADATQIYYVGTTRGGPITQRLYSLTLADGATRPVISDTVSGLSGKALASPAVSNDGAWIYFITKLPFFGPPSGDIWRVHPDGTGLTRLLTGQVFRDSPTPSPDGTRMAYVEGDPLTTNQIRILDLQSGNLVAIAAPGASEIRWSPTADRIAINSLAGLYVVNGDGSQLTQLTQLAPPSSYFAGLSWSPDGHWILAAPGGVPTIIEPTKTGLRLPLSFAGVGTSWSPR